MASYTGIPHDQSNLNTVKPRSGTKSRPSTMNRNQTQRDQPSSIECKELAESYSQPPETGKQH